MAQHRAAQWNECRQFPIHSSQYFNSNLGQHRRHVLNWKTIKHWHIMELKLIEIEIVQKHKA